MPRWHPVIPLSAGAPSPQRLDHQPFGRAADDSTRQIVRVHRSRRASGRLRLDAIRRAIQVRDVRFIPAATSGAADGPSRTALMLCDEDISAQVTQALRLASPAPTRSSFVDELFSCTHDLPVGPLALSVHHSDTASAAGTNFDQQRGILAPTSDLAGLGERAYGAPAGIVVVINDNEVLTVDASRAPGDLRPGPAEALRYGLRDRLRHPRLLDRRRRRMTSTMRFSPSHRARWSQRA